jgi:signal transduction histidine kinase
VNGAPLLVLGLLIVLSAVFGARIREQDRGGVGRFVLSPLHPASWAATGAILLGFWVELFAFVALVSAMSMGASLLIVGIGVVIVGLGIEGCRLLAREERWRATLADPRPLRAHAYRPYGSGFRDVAFAVFLDVNRWQDVVYGLVAFPLTMLEFLAVAVLWGIALALLSMPLWLTMSGGPLGPTWLSMSPAVVATVGALAGLVLAMAAASAAQGLMRLHRAVVAGLLCESEQHALARRVATLEGSRRAVLDVEASELRRIERDLHDGAQQRLVMLTIDLGMAADRIDSDPASARDLVVEAQTQARLALAELRDLVRGIAPAILLDRGLVPALSALAGRSPISTVVLSSVPAGERMPDAVERAAYFVAAEALANVAKHAAATRCEVRCRRDPDRLVVEVWDDGAGGAAIEALDGRFSVDSPAGGPTLVRAEIPVPAPSVQAPGLQATGPGFQAPAGPTPGSAPGSTTAGPGIPGWTPPP